MKTNVGKSMTQRFLPIFLAVLIAVAFMPSLAVAADRSSSKIETIEDTDAELKIAQKSLDDARAAAETAKSAAEKSKTAADTAKIAYETAKEATEKANQTVKDAKILAPGEYDLEVGLKNAGRTSSDSMCAFVLEGYSNNSVKKGHVVVDENGSAKVTVYFNSAGGAPFAGIKASVPVALDVYKEAHSSNTTKNQEDELAETIKETVEMTSNYPTSTVKYHGTNVVQNGKVNSLKNETITLPYLAEDGIYQGYIYADFMAAPVALYVKLSDIPLKYKDADEGEKLEAAVKDAETAEKDAKYEYLAAKAEADADAAESAKADAAVEHYQATVEKIQSAAAKNSAESAQSKAEAAQKASEENKTSAEAAQKAAEEAQSKAEAAQKAAEEAQKAAETARKAAEEARNKAEAAQKTAEEARTVAEQAKADAANDKAAAEQAKADARAALNDARTAKADAEQAKADAQKLLDQFRNELKASRKTSVTVKNVTYRITGSTTAQVTKVSKNVKSASIAPKVKIGGKTYKVTSMKAKAFSGTKKLKSVTIGKNVKAIESKAFYKDSKLKTITFKGKVVKKMGKNAFKGIAKKAVFKAPKAKTKAYKKMIKKAGAPKSFKVKSV